MSHSNKQLKFKDAKIKQNLRFKITNIWEKFKNFLNISYIVQIFNKKYGMMFKFFIFLFICCCQMWLYLPMDRSHFLLCHKIDKKKLLQEDEKDENIDVNND